MSQYFINNRDLLINKYKLHHKYLNFIIANRQTLYTENIITITIPFVDESSIKLRGVAYALEFDLNFILLGQLCESGIINVNSRNAIKLIQIGWGIVHVRRD